MNYRTITNRGGRRFFTDAQYEQLRANNEATRVAQRAGLPEPDHVPVVRLFVPLSRCCWLLSEVYENGRAYGWCDLGWPELGYVSLDELAEFSRLVPAFGTIVVERDTDWASDGRTVGDIAGLNRRRAA
ncbi:MAG: DUF2958 domain-containing protein [Bacteroidota bacterium]